ncbi:acyltransferase family protein [Undibacterium sp. TJN25]|uniref:acyltransferase family protein n=1 Tax=Undibacterium sp. TJN25 TaxID=3413056 RepID=UPI003BF018F3
MSVPQKAPAGRYAYIDVLRGLAALFVVYQHTAEITPAPGVHVNPLENSLIEFFTRTIGVGETGVCIFLMISGFVVPFSLFRYQSAPIKNFIAHRFFRLYPAYWLSIPLALVFVSWRLGMQDYGQPPGWQISWQMVVANLSMLQSFLGFDDIMGQYWTLALELVFYGACILLFAAGYLQSFKAIMLFLLCMLALQMVCRIIPGVDKDTLELVISFRYLDFMFFGLLYRKWLLEADKKAGKQAALILMLAFLTFGALPHLRNFVNGDPAALRVQASHLAAVCIFVVCTRFYQPSNAVGIFLGKISYSIYLFHPVVFYPLFFFWFQSSGLRSYPHSFITLSMLATIAVSYGIYRIVEQPFIELGRKLFPGGETWNRRRGAQGMHAK